MYIGKSPLDEAIRVFNNDRHSMFSGNFRFFRRNEQSIAKSVY